MARRVFFSFHFQRDIWRVSQVRNSGITKRSIEGQKFLDHADWEKVQRKGESSIKKWIDSQLNGASVTVVLIGAETARRPWVQYEIEQSHKLGKGLLGIRIHNIKDSKGKKGSKGENPFALITDTSQPQSLFSLLFNRTLEDIIPIYDWVEDDGYSRFSSWVEDAAKKAGY